MNRHNRFYLPYSAFPNNYNPCSPDDFISDEMSGYQSINYLEFDEFRNGSECKDSRSTRRERLSHYGGKWSDRGEPNGGYYNHPEDRGYPSNHCNNKCPDQHSKGGRKGSLKKPDSQESTSKQEQVILIESDDSGSVEVVQETSPPEKVPDATLSDIQSRKKEKRKLRKQRQRKQGCFKSPGTTREPAQTYHSHIKGPRPSEKTNKDSTSAPVGLNTVEQNSCGARSSAQTSKSTANGRSCNISMEHFIKKAEVAHCLACDEYIPMQYYLIELHLRSPDHRANCKGMMVQSKNLGLTTVQRLLRLKCTQQKLKCYLKDIGVTIEPKRNHREVWSTQQRAVPEATQEAELPCEQVMQAAEAVEKWKDQEAGLFSAQVIQADEKEKDGIDLKAKLICGQAIQATAAVEDGKTQLQETVCVREIQADGAGEVKNVVEPSIEQVIQGNDAVEDGKKQKVEPFCGLMMEADEVVGDGKDQEVEPICAQVIQANKIVGKTKDREVDEAVDYRKDQETEPLSKKMVLAPDPVINGESQACEESIPATENLQEPEQWQRTQPLFDLLDEEDDLEGVELGEEEMGEDI
ncbi:A-kinase anchor protein 8-like [Bagarius yarrelli]|uniref:A-kinase anchor protein 8-like n=1 Tax=Bagarius yarrelli TaxID=175774 RepID=A0A556VAG2_BAGYA|nr:A-kinase anchor protein 8-like [Bagarius yarrelli]